MQRHCELAQSLLVNLSESASLICGEGEAVGGMVWRVEVNEVPLLGRYLREVTVFQSDFPESVLTLSKRFLVHNIRVFITSHWNVEMAFSVHSP